MIAHKIAIRILIKIENWSKQHNTQKFTWHKKPPTFMNMDRLLVINKPKLYKVFVLSKYSVFFTYRLNVNTNIFYHTWNPLTENLPKLLLEFLFLLLIYMWSYEIITLKLTSSNF